MKRFFALALIMAFAVSANAQVFSHNNEIGFFSTATPTSDADCVHMGSGMFTMYAVIGNPYNVHTNTPIEAIGGFEFRVNLPASVILLSGVLHPSATNFMAPPDFYVGCNVPVVNGMATLVTMNMFDTAGLPGTASIGQVSSAPSLPNDIAITDFNDGFSISPAYSTAPLGALNAPIFAFNGTLEDLGVVDSDAASWGELKSLFR